MNALQLHSHSVDAMWQPCYFYFSSSSILKFDLDGYSYFRNWVEIKSMRDYALRQKTWCPLACWREIESFMYFNLLMTDKVFGLSCSSQKVYEEGAKDVALSALTGINGNCIYCNSMFPCDNLCFWLILSTSLFFSSLQQQFSHMGRLAVVRHIPWKELQKMLWRTSLNTSGM